MVFFPSTEAGVSKTRTQDDTVVIGSPRNPDRLQICKFADALYKYAARKGPESRVFDLPYHIYEDMIATTSVSLGFGTVTSRVTPHMFRHGGASYDAYRGATLPEVQLRGMWGQQMSCARYMKAGVYTRRLSAFTPV